MKEIVDKIDETIADFNKFSYDYGELSAKGNLVMLVNEIERASRKIRMYEEMLMSEDKHYLPIEYPEKQCLKLIRHLQKIDISEEDTKKLKTAMGRKHPGLQLSEEFINW